MNALVAAAGPLGVPVAEELVRACWGIDTLFFDPSPPHGPRYEKIRREVSFPLQAVRGGDWERFWRQWEAPRDAVLFLIGCPEPPAERLSTGSGRVYALQPGLLPEQAGPDAAAWALFRGEPAVGVTLYRRGARPYSGELIFRDVCPVREEDDAGTLERVLQAAAIRTVRAFWEVSTRAQLRPQGTFTAASPLPPWRGGAIPWTEPARRVRGFVRACAHPYEGAHARAGGRRITVWKASLAASPEGVRPGRPGEVRSADPFLVWTGDGLLELDIVQPDGEKELPGMIYAKDRLKPGDVLDGVPARAAT